MESLKQTTKQGKTMITFQAGNNYQGNFICNSDATVNIHVIKRTAKTVVVKCLDSNEEKRLRIGTHDDSEFVKPEGNYSMSPRVYARKKV